MNACQDSNIDFHDVAHEPAAVALCRTCPRVEQCAIDGAKEPFGVWGATTPRDRGFKHWGRRNTAPTNQDRIAPHLTRQWVHQLHLAEWTGLKVNTVNRTLLRMKRDGLVEHYKGGYWRLA